MPKQTANRPTNTDYSSLLLDFTGVDFTGGNAPQEAQQEEPGFLSKLANSGSAILEGIGMIPGDVADTIRDAWAGGDIDVTDKADIERRAQKEREREAYLRKYQGKTFEGIPEAMGSMGYSGGTMLATLGAGAAGTAVAGPVAGAAAGMAASGTVAYRATKQDFLRRLLGEAEKALGRMPTQEEWDRIAAEFDSEATEYGLWEAGPEAASNLFMTKLLGPLGSKIFKGGVGQAAKRVVGLYGEGQGTETGTHWGQGDVEARLGLRDKAPTLLEAFKEQAPATFWQTTLMAGGKKAADLVSNRMRRRSDDAANNTINEGEQAPDAEGENPQEGSAFMDAGSVQPAAPYVFEQQPGNMPVPRSAAPRDFVRDYQDEMSYAETDNFIREQEEREQAQADADFLIEQGRAPSVRYTLHQQALEAGETIDLLQLPQDASGMAQGISVFGLPEGTGAQAMGTNDTGLGTIAPPTDFYEPRPITTPYQPKQALPQEPGASAGLGQWAGGRSQLSYPWPGMAQGIGGLMGTQQPEQVTPPAMPTQSQITNNQVTPRADTTAMAEGMGLEPPTAIPQEAQTPQAAPEIPAHPKTPQVEPQWSYALPSFVTAPYAKGNPGARNPRRADLINSLPEESRHDARRMTNAELERYVETDQNPVPFTEENLSRDPTYNLPTAPAGTVFVLPDGKKTKPFPKTDFSTPEKASVSKKRVEQWALNNIVAQGAKINESEGNAGQELPEQAASETQNSKQDNAERKYWGTIQNKFGEYKVHTENGHVVIGKRRISLAEAIDDMQKAIGRYGQDGATRRFKAIEDAINFLKQEEEGRNRIPESTERTSYGTIPTETGQTHVYAENGHVVVGDRRITPAEAKGIVQSALKKHGPGAAQEFEPLRRAAQAIEESERRGGKPKNMFADIVNEDRVNSLTGSEIDMINAMFEKKGQADSREKRQEESAPLPKHASAKASESSGHAAAPTPSEPQGGMVESQKTAEENRHVRDDGKQSAKQPVVEKQAAVASGKQSEAGAGDVEQPEPRKAAESSRHDGGKRREPDVSDDGHTGRHSAGGNSGGVLSDDGLPGRGTPGRTSDKDSGLGGEGTRGGRREGRGDGRQVGDDGQPSARGFANQNNHRIAEDDPIVPGGAVARAKANIAAIRLVKKLEKEGRAATPEEKKILTQFTGWGSLAQTVFNPDHTRTALSEAKAKERGWKSPVENMPASEREKYEKWKRQYGAVLMPELGGLLTEKELAAAEKSTLNAHYTDRNVISAMWKMAQRLGFHGGRILEPSAGTGLFFGLMPEEISRNSSLVGVELDEMTGKILKYLYPDADIQVTGFEKSKRLGDNTVDLVISNVPFGNIPVFDKARPQYSKQSIHNYFFSRALDAVRPGGLVMQITSHFTLDSGSTARLREEWGKKADLVAAVRLPGTAFEKNAGTEVTTDIIVFRKKTDNGAQFGQPFRNLATVETKEGNTQVNEYFVSHPEMVLGEHSLAGSMYGGNEYALLPKKGEALQEGLNRAVAAVPANVYGIEMAMPAQVESHAGRVAQEGAKEGSLVEDGEGVYVVVDGQLEKPEWAGKPRRLEQAKAYIGVKDSALSLISAMNTDEGDVRVKKLQKELNDKYDAYVREFGPINKPGNKFLEDDIEFPTMAALERVDEVAVQKPIKSGPNKGKLRLDKEKRVSKADIFSKRTVFPFHAPDHADSTDDAIKISRIYKNKIDLPYIAGLLGVSTEQAKKRLLDTMEVFENPESGLLEPRDVYLSGNVREKLQRAEAAAEENPAYAENVTALREVQPSRIGIDSIYAKIGSSWLPSHIYEGFLNHVGVKSAFVDRTRLPGDEGSTTWKVQGYDLSAEAINKWGTERASVMRIVEDSLNLKHTVVMDTFRDGTSSKSVRNEAETLAAQEKQRLLQEEFSKWIKGSKFAQEVEDLYNETFNGSVIRHFDVPDIKYYPGASHSIELRDNQKKGVARALQESCLLAHGVGSGKTMLQITLAMEMRRLGTAKKPWIVVQGPTLAQFAATFKELYPGARILAPKEDKRKAKNRRRLLAQIASGDWDAVITPHGFFNGVSVSPETEERFITEQIAEYEEMLSGTDSSERNTRKEIEKKIDRLRTRLEKLADTRKDENIYFDDLGIDALIIDEAHAYKRGQFVTKMDNVKGLDRDSSQRSMQLLMKSRMVQAKTGGKNVILATGTPISNTLTEMWTMFRYTRPDLLKQFGVEQFDDFATAFAATSVTQEETATGEWKDVERFNKYVNGPELLTLWGLGADVAITEDLSSIKNMPKLKGGKIHEVSVERSEALSNYIESLRQERIAWDALPGKEKREKSYVPLTIYGRAKQAAIDLRLVDPSLEDEHESKANIAVRNIFERWEKYKDDKAAQIVFSDTFQSRDKSFNLFEDIKKKLIQLGVPAHEIAIIHDYKTDEARKRLFDSVKTGDVRVLMGTTEKLGVGVNVQDRLVTAHHLDAPQRPMDFEQRNGRIRRPGNIYQDVEILTYGTKNTLDSVTFQQLISKQKFINQLLRGNVSDRSFENPFDATQATFEDMMAAFSGNPLAKEKMQLMAEVRRLKAQLEAHNSQISQQRYNLRYMRSRLEEQRRLLPKEKAVTDFVKKYFPDGDIRDRKEVAKQINEWLAPETQKILASIENITTEGQWFTKNKSTFEKAVTIDIGHGLSVNISLVPRIVFPSSDGSEIDRYVVSSFKMTGPHGIEESDSFNGAQGLLTRLSNRLSLLQDSEEIAKTRIRDTEAQIESLEKEVERPFRQQGELDTATKRLAEVEKELEEATKIDKEEAKENGEEPHASISPGQYLARPKRGTRHLHRDAVQRVIDALGKAAKNAAESRVVQTFEELPENIRRRYASEQTALEGVFDPSTGQVWFVADNISDAGRAAEVWAHEQIVHNGLRGMLSDAERRSILNRLWLSMGGMGNARIRQIARTYGLHPKTSAADRLTVMEEVVASLAEKRRLNELTPQEVSLWKRIVRAVAQAWERLVRTVAGRSSASNLPDVDGLLTALGRYVMDGIPPVQRTSHGPLFASKSDDVRSASEAAWTQLQRDMAEWGRQVDAFDPNRVVAGGKTENLTVGVTPDVLQKLGAPELPMTMTARNLSKILSGNADHNLPKDLVKQLPRALAEPVMVFESATVPDSFVVLTELTHQGRSVMAAIHVDTLQQDIRVNEIASAYKRGNEGWYIKQIEDGRLLYQDKKKSLAWARTHRLQLPKVRKLPARLTDGKILTEADVVKPMPPAGRGQDNAPLASLKGILGMGVKDAAKASDAPEIQHLFRKSDLTFMQSIVQLPHWIAKQAKEFATIYDRQLQRMDERSAALRRSLETVPSLFGKSRLSGPDLESLKKLLWEIEGRETWQEHVSGVDKFVTKEVLASGRELIEVNPKFYEVFKKALDAADATPRAKEAMLEIRKSLDNDLVIAHNRMASMSEMSDDAIREFRQSIGHVPNYFPHHRYGAYFVQAKVGGEVVFRQHFDAVNEKAAMAKARKIAKEQRENYPGATWLDGKNDRLPDEILGAPIDSEAMEQIIRAATSKIGDKERAREIGDLLTEGVADVLKSRGWGSHGIQRKGTPGFETDDIARVLYDYKAGLNGWLTKMEAARDFSDALSKIDARKKPNLWKYASQYTKDMLRNSDKVDRITGNIKAVAFAWYLGGSIKTAVVNATQNLVVGVPRLQMDVTGGGLMWLKGAQDALVDRVTGNKGHGLADDEARLIEELYGESVITDAFMEEVRGQLRGVTGASLWNKFTKILGLPMSEIERFNRASLALAAYRAARSGKLKEKAKGKYGIEGKATYEQAKEFASEVVRDAHFVYGKSNMPEFMRSNTAGRALASMYTFRTFSHNMLAMWAWALKTQGREGAAFCAKSIGATMALGGVTALPLYATLMALFQAVTGDDDDWTETIRNYLPQNNLLRDAVCYGAPAIAGVSIGGSLKMETPLTKGLTKGKNPKEVLTDSIGDIIGIPYDLGIVKVSNMMDAQAQGNYWRMIEEAMPTFVKNGMQAWRLYSEGQTTMRGRPINSPGKEGARKLSGAEAVGKALGFQPVSSTKSYEAYAASKRRDEVRSAKLDELTVMALKTHDTGDPSGRKQAIKEIEAWNAKMRKEGKPQMTITLQDVMRRVKARRRQNRVSDKQREKGARQAEIWGV